LAQNMDRVEFWCLVCFVGAVILYVLAVRSFIKAKAGLAK
jgi:hypothetical protein